MAGKSVRLYPINAMKEKKTQVFGVVDIETRDWTNFLIIGYYTKHYEESEDGFRKVSGEQLEMFENMDEFAEWMFEPEQIHKIIYAHFGGKFDFNFILRAYYHMPDKFYIDRLLPRGSGLLSFAASTMKHVEVLEEGLRESDVIRKHPKGGWLIKDRTIEFRDSSALLPFGLKSLCENFKVDHLKLEINYEEIVEVTPELKKYLEHDLRGHFEVLEKFYEWPLIKNAGGASTVAGQAMRVFQTYMEEPIAGISGEQEAFIRSAYFGGRTEVFKPYFEQREDNLLLNSYDINSLYPSVMLGNHFPGKVDYYTDKFDVEKMGFYDVTVRVPKMYVPPLGMVFVSGEGKKTEKKFIFPTGEFRGRWSSIELKYAMTLGVEVLKFHGGYVMRDIGPIFDKYITDLYDMRKKADKKSVDNVLCKLLMNSTYGRFGLRREREQIAFADLGVENKKLHMELKDGKKVIQLVKSATVLDESYSNVAISAWVTSLARICMHKEYMKAPEHLYYTDTDSLYTTHKYKSNPDNLGELKFEYKVKRACFLLPKTYMIESNQALFKHYMPNGKEHELLSSVKAVMKGFDRKKISQFTITDFQVALEGDLRRMRTTNPRKFATFKTAIKKNEFVRMVEESPRGIKSMYDKRRVFKDQWGNFDTEALHIENGKIVNQTSRSLYPKFVQVPLRDKESRA